MSEEVAHIFFEATGYLFWAIVLGIVLYRTTNQLYLSWSNKVPYTPTDQDYLMRHVHSLYNPALQWYEYRDALLSKLTDEEKKQIIQKEKEKDSIWIL